MRHGEREKDGKVVGKVRYRDGLKGSSRYRKYGEKISKKERQIVKVGGRDSKRERERKKERKKERKRKKERERKKER